MQNCVSYNNSTKVENQIDTRESKQDNPNEEAVFFYLIDFCACAHR